MYKLIATLGKPIAAAAILVAPTTIASRAFAANVQPVAAQQAVPVRKPSLPSGTRKFVRQSPSSSARRPNIWSAPRPRLRRPPCGSAGSV